MQHGICPLNCLDCKTAAGIVWLAKLIISYLTTNILIHQISTVLNVPVEFENLKTVKHSTVAEETQENLVTKENWLVFSTFSVFCL